MPWFSPYFEPLLAVATATLDQNGTLIEANAGFLRLIAIEGQQPIGALVNHFFQQPEFAALTRAQTNVDGQIFSGLMTIGDRMVRTWSLQARVWRVDAQIRLLAEYDIEELMKLNDAVLKLNHDYADAQFQLAQTNVKLQQREAQIVVLSLTDQLTGVGNRRRLDQAIATEISRANRSGEKCSAIMVDLDHFKKVNDTYGHKSGDKVLASFGHLLRREVRATDIVTRFGGEEFVVLMPNTNLEEAIAVADRIRDAQAANSIDPLGSPVTASFGVVELAAGEQSDALLSQLDKALYSAKRSGRDCVVAG